MRVRTNERRAILAALALVALAGAVSCFRLLGRLEGPGEVTKARIPSHVVAARQAAQRRAAAEARRPGEKQILFGDLHVHTTFSSDAFMRSLPLFQGEGAHPIADACDYARFCSALDFWSINDHAESSTPRKWRETRESIRECNAVAGDAENPDLVAFLGWEWTQNGATPETHYGHKNVIFRGIDDDQAPARPIGARGGPASQGLRDAAGVVSPLLGIAEFTTSLRYFNLMRIMAELREVPPCPEGVPSPELPHGCYESAPTPAELFAKLDEWKLETLVIPHGNAWGSGTPAGVTWDKQLLRLQYDPEKQKIIEVMSGHGNSEEYREWKEIAFGERGEPLCPAPRKDYLPSCWRAGELVEKHCREEGGGEARCAARAEEARARYLALGVAGHLIAGQVPMEEWLDSGQCRDCFQPAFNYRPGGSTQYALALSNFDDPARPRRFRFGMIAASDNHSARPGTGYKEFDRPNTTESGGPRSKEFRERLESRRKSFDPWAFDVSQRNNPEAFAELIAGLGAAAREFERGASFYNTGGLAAVHAEGRSRAEIWAALERKEIYGTSGDRILLWFDLVNGEAGKVPMGGEVHMDTAPRFEVRAAGAFKQKPGCPEYSTEALSSERLELLCKGECHNPSDERKLVTRIEVVRIRPQTRPGEPLGKLIDDPWKVLECKPDPAGCAVEFDDPDFAKAGRDTVYYVRAIEEPSPAVNGGNLRCRRAEDGNCLEIKPCYGDYRTPASDDCLSTVEERAWSSPIFVDFTVSGDAPRRSIR